jgi:hypothetical protein
MASSGTIDVDEVATRGLSDAQLKDQQDQLKAGQKNGADKGGPTVAHNRSTGSDAQGVQGGFIDQLTRRDPSDVMEGHFCTVDRTHKGVDESFLPAGEDGYGVYESPAVTDEHGYPVMATVRLRSNQLITVPYEALRPAESRGR